MFDPYLQRHGETKMQFLKRARRAALANYNRQMRNDESTTWGFWESVVRDYDREIRTEKGKMK